MAGKIALIIIDSVGIGEMPDAADYGDEGSDTLGNIYKFTPGLSLANLEKLGLCSIPETNLPKSSFSPIGAYGKMREKSAGKDSTTGHWEMAGLVVEEAFATFPNGFSDEIINEFKSKTGYDILLNRPYSGTEAIKDYGLEHMKTKKLIVYTSADSVFQIAAHEGIVGLDELYRICEIARKMLDKYQVSRVIARPFLGDSPENFFRTANRRDFSIIPIGETILDKLIAKGMHVLSIGKIYDLFAGKGISEAIHIASNAEGIEEIEKAIKGMSTGLIFANLVDFDQLYGHRNDISGYANALKEFDLSIPSLIEALGEDDLMIITADHGNDPSTPSTDHSREFVPILAYRKGMKPICIGIRESFVDIAATLAEFYELEPLKSGFSFLSSLYYKE